MKYWKSKCSFGNINEILEIQEKVVGMDWGGKRHLRFTTAVDGDTALADAALSPGTQRGADPGIKIKQI